MKKLLLLSLLLSVATVYTNAQKGEKSLLLELGYKTEVEQFLLGGELRYGLTENLRLAPDLQLIFPKNHTTGLDINVNMHYEIPIQGDLSFYPLAGLNIANTRYSNRGYTNSNTELGFNLGMGVDYYIQSNSYLNLQFKYTFSDWDNAVISMGYGFKF